MSRTDDGSFAQGDARLFGIKAKDSKPARTSTIPSLSILMPTSSTSPLPAANNFKKHGH